MPRYPSPPPSLVEEDPLAQARLDALDLTFSTDVERDAAVATLNALVALKQDAATAATDAELDAVRTALDSAIAAKQDASSAATSADLDAAIANLQAAIDLKQASATAATDAELQAAVDALNASLAGKEDASLAATDVELQAAIDSLNNTIATKQDAATAATDAELSAGLAAKQDAATASTDAERDAAIEAHRVDTTDIHGIADTALLLQRGQSYGTGLWTPGRWYFDNGSATQTAGGNNTAVVSPLRLPPGQPIDSLAFVVVVAGEAGSLLEFSLVDDTGRGLPGLLRQTWLAIDASTTGLKQCDLPAAYTPTRSLHWISLRFYNAPTTRPQVRASPSPQLGMSVATSASVVTAFSQSGNNGVSVGMVGAAPADFSALPYGAPATMGVRVAARAA